MGAMRNLIMAMAVIMAVVGRASAAPCSSNVIGLQRECMDYVTAVQKHPSAACCTQLYQIRQSSTVCVCIATIADLIRIFTKQSFSDALANKLPKACHVCMPNACECAPYRKAFPSPNPPPVPPSCASPPSN